MKNAMNTVGIAVFRKDGWIAVKSPGEGELVSRIFSAPGNTLKLNGKGKFTVELLNASGDPLPDYSGSNAALVTGDTVNGDVVWKNGTCRKLPSIPFRVRIIMDSAELYTIHFNREGVRQ